MNPNRYSRQITLPEIGEAGQKKLAGAKVLIIGAGGLGSPAALYLAGAGVGTLGIVDSDKVELVNLHRQVIHRQKTIGMPKAESAKMALNEFNPDVKIRTYNEKIIDANAQEIIMGYDIVVDAVDNFEARYVVNAACVKLQVPFVHGSILKFTGQVSVFNCSNPPPPPFSKGGKTVVPPLYKGGKTVVSPLCKGGQGGIFPCYACLYPVPPPEAVAPKGSTAGIIGMMPGMIGTLQALEVVKLIAGFGEPLIGKLLIFDGLTGRMRTLEVKRDPKCEVCSSPLP